MKIGVLALQGDFASHAKRAREIGAEVVFVRKCGDLMSADSLIMPGGESTALLKLLDPALEQLIAQRASEGMPILATCAGLILIAREVGPQQQRSLGLLDVSVERNAYGRQADSFVDESLALTRIGRSALGDVDKLEGVFIRAPRITRVGPNVEVLAERGGEPVLVRQGNLLAATFHPELSAGARGIHKLLAR